MCSNEVRFIKQYHFQFIAKGGGSANKTFLFQQTKALLNPESLVKFLNGLYFWLLHSSTRKNSYFGNLSLPSLSLGYRDWRPFC